MKPKSLGIAAAAAVGLVALGLALQEFRKPPAAAAQTGERFFPELIDSINDVRSMTVTTAEGGYRIAYVDGTWGLAEKGGYPVDPGKVSKALIAFAELEKVEPKTSDPARYAELGVQDVAAEGSASKLVTLRDGSDAELASLIVGDRRSSGRGGPSFFVRDPGDEQSWLVEGNLTIEADGPAWLDKKILEVKRGDVRAVETAHPGGESVLVSKGAPEDPGFEVHDVPADRELAYASVANGMGSALEYLNLQDVVPAGEFEAPEGEPVRTSYWTFDGMRVDVSLYEKDAKTYAAFRASYDAEGPPGLAAIGPQPVPEGDEAAEGEEGEGAAEGATPPEPERRPADEVRAEAEALDARLAPWVFEIPAYNKTNFTKRMEDLLKKVEPETAPGELDGGFEDELGAETDDATEDGERALLEDQLRGDEAADEEAASGDGDEPAPETPDETESDGDPEGGSESDGEEPPEAAAGGDGHR